MDPLAFTNGLSSAGEKDVEILFSLLSEKMLREQTERVERDAHPKQHGLVQATFTIESDLPQNLRLGLFQAGHSFDAWVRFSNQHAPPKDDKARDIRGVAIKVLNVPGQTITLPGSQHANQDFVLISTPVFVTKNLRQFRRLIQALVKGKWWLCFFFLRHPRALINLLRSCKRCESPLTQRYWSTTPYRLGDGAVVKYSLIPRTAQPPAENAQMKSQCPETHANYLRQRMRWQLEKSDWAFDFCMQLQQDKMPAEDAGRLWDEKRSPFIKVARVTIAKQDFDTAQRDALGESLSFTPWHCRPEHEPLGDINAARRVLYERLSEFRHSHNGSAKKEPLSL